MCPESVGMKLSNDYFIEKMNTYFIIGRLTTPIEEKEHCRLEFNAVNKIESSKRELNRKMVMCTNQWLLSFDSYSVNTAHDDFFFARIKNEKREII